MGLETRPSSRFTPGKVPGYREAVQAVRYLQGRGSLRPRVGIVLGSGLGKVAERLRSEIRVPYRSIPHFPAPTVTGHRGEMHLGRWGGASVAVLEGRLHVYEGYSPAEVAFPIRVLGLWGVNVLILTCAAGGIARQALPGSFMIFSDHLNFQGVSPLAGAHDERWGRRFIELSAAYDAGLRLQARRAAKKCGLKCFEGVYAAVLGPNYETPAEIRALARLGADAVGMSTVLEVLAARQLGISVLAVAIIANRAAGLSRLPLSHQEVLAVAKRASQGLAQFFDTLVPEILGE